jgi:integrase
MTAARGRPKSRPPKRANGTGTCRWVASRNRWLVRVGGKDRYFVREDEARAHLASFDERTAPRESITIAELAWRWYKSASPEWSIARVGNVRRQINRTIVNDPIGRVRADRIEVDDVEVWTQAMADAGLRKPTIRTYRSTLMEALEWGRVRKFVPHHPGPGGTPHGMKPAGTKTWLNLEQASRLIQFCTREHEPWGPFFITSALLGLRPGETAGIDRDAVDFDNDTVSIRVAVSRDGGTAKKLAETTKTGRTRLLWTPPQVKDALRRQCEIQDVARMVYADEWPDTWGNLLFLNAQSHRTARAGQVPSEMTLRNHLTRICREAGIPRVTPYELRHSCASIRLHMREEPRDVAEHLGTSVAMLRLHYGHLIDPVLGRNFKAWDDVPAEPAG